jgi:hypothetical protein
MTVEELKAIYGAEYPAAVTLGGSRMPLVHDGRFLRIYRALDSKASAEISKFMDGTATITLAILQTEWPAWSERERMEFCNALSTLGAPDDPDIIRFVMRSGGPEHWTCIASLVAYALPAEESFEILRDALSAANPTANIAQAIAATKHPRAEGLLREHLNALWARPELWADDSFVNWNAFDATCCIGNLLELGAPSAEFEEKVRALVNHACSHNRQSCSTFLAKYYDWLPKTDVRPVGA